MFISKKEQEVFGDVRVKKSNLLEKLRVLDSMEEDRSYQVNREHYNLYNNNNNNKARSPKFLRSAMDPQQD